MTGLRTFITYLLFGLLCSSVSAEQIYKSVDKDGNVIFSDHPTGNAATSETVDVEPVNTVSPPPPMPVPATAAPATPAAPSYTVTITAPAHETTIPNGPGSFSVAASTSPPLQAGETLQLLMDGEKQGDPQSSGSWQLTNVFRGEHHLSVQRLSADGEVLASSPNAVVYVHRPTVGGRR